MKLHNRSAEWVTAFLHAPALSWNRISPPDGAAKFDTDLMQFVSEEFWAEKVHGRAPPNGRKAWIVPPGETKEYTLTYGPGFALWHRRDASTENFPGLWTLILRDVHADDAALYTENGIAKAFIKPAGSDSKVTLYFNEFTSSDAATARCPSPPVPPNANEPKSTKARATDSPKTTAGTDPPTAGAFNTLGPGKMLDSVIEALCDKSTLDMKSETLSAKTAALVGMPAGEIGHFRCGLKGDVGLAKWDISLVDGSIYSVSVFGDAIKPGNRWTVNHFARLGAEFVKPLLTPTGQTKLAELVATYASKEPEAGARWTVDQVAVNLHDVMAGDQLGKWVIMFMPTKATDTNAPAIKPTSPPPLAAPTEAATRPSRVTASSAHRASAGYTYVPANLVDGDRTSSWQPATGTPPTWFRLDFPNEITVTSVAIANGFQATDKFGDEFLLNSRISNGRIRFSDDSEIPIKFETDARGFVTFTVPERKTRSITVVVDGVFRGTKWNDLAVSEVEVRARTQ
ncbi:MAG: discoidin domain-containing protein [Kofleriaceae bacterium]